MGVVNRKHAREGKNVTFYLNRELMRSIEIAKQQRTAKGEKLSPINFERQFMMEAITEKIKRELDVTVRAGLRDDRGDKRYYATDEGELDGS